MVIMEGSFKVNAQLKTKPSRSCPPTYTQIRMRVKLDAESVGFLVTVKPVLSDHLKIDTKRILMTNVSLMK